MSDRSLLVIVLVMYVPALLLLYLVGKPYGFYVGSAAGIGWAASVFLAWMYRVSRRRIR
jgi:hypothetical protein